MLQHSFLFHLSIITQENVTPPSHYLLTYYLTSVTTVRQLIHRHLSALFVLYSLLKLQDTQVHPNTYKCNSPVSHCQFMWILTICLALHHLFSVYVGNCFMPDVDSLQDISLKILFIFLHFSNQLCSFDDLRNAKQIRNCVNYWIFDYKASAKAISDCDTDTLMYSSSN